MLHSELTFVAFSFLNVKISFGFDFEPDSCAFAVWLSHSFTCNMISDEYNIQDAEVYHRSIQYCPLLCSIFLLSFHCWLLCIEILFLHSHLDLASKSKIAVQRNNGRSSSFEGDLVGFRNGSNHSGRIDGGD